MQMNNSSKNNSNYNAYFGIKRGSEEARNLIAYMGKI